MSTPGPVVLFSVGLARDGKRGIQSTWPKRSRGAGVEVICLDAGPGAAPSLGRGGPGGGGVDGQSRHLTLWAALRGLRHIPRLYRISNAPAHPACATSACASWPPMLCDVTIPESKWSVTGCSSRAGTSGRRPGSPRALTLALALTQKDYGAAAFGPPLARWSCRSTEPLADAVAPDAGDHVRAIRPTG